MGDGKVNSTDVLKPWYLKNDGGSEVKAEGMGKTEAYCLHCSIFSV
jgi:hypothetical protein